jgi:hypothetical protein
LQETQADIIHQISLQVSLTIGSGGLYYRSCQTRQFGQ